MTRTLARHPFALGLLAPNVWGGLTQTLAPERWEATWPNNVALARMADAAGLDFVVPLASWLGLGSVAETDAHSLDTLTWATGVLAATRRLRVFATVHTAFANPVVAAKQIATCDHVGAGRLGVHVVSGALPDEYALMGVEQPDPDERLALAQEWLDVVRRAWREVRPFEHRGRFFRLRGVLSEPKPYGGEEPLVLCAGSSPAERSFATRNADCVFLIVQTLDGLAETVAGIRAAAGRPVAVIASAHVICRPTRRETEEYYHHVVRDHGDWAAGDRLLRAAWPDADTMPAELREQLRERCVSGHGTWPLVGTPDEVAHGMRLLHAAGIDGVAFSLVNYLDDLPVVREAVLPRLARYGMRAVGAAV